MRPVRLLSIWSLAVASRKELTKQALPEPQQCHFLHVPLMCIAIIGTDRAKLLGKHAEPGHQTITLADCAPPWVRPRSLLA